MPDGIRWVGVDVHARESTFAVFDQATGEVTTRRVVGRPHELLPWDLMRARNRIGKFLLRREIYWEGRGEAWSGQASLVADLGAVRRPRLAGDAGRLSPRSRCADRPSRSGRGRPRAARAHRAVRADGRAAQMPARDRHADGARAVRRDRRVGAVRSSRAARLLPRDRPVRAHHRSATVARRDHQGRRPPTPAGCWSRRPTITAATLWSAKRSSAASAATPPRSWRRTDSFARPDPSSLRGDGRSH